MGIFGRLLLPRQQRQDAEKARQIIEAAFIESREPRNCTEAAASGADIRRRLFSVVDRLEAEMGQLVIACAQREGVLMTHPRLTQELHKRSDGEVLERSIFLCFITPDATTRLNAGWPRQVAGYQSRPNTDDVISEKATILTAYVVHNLGTGIEVSKEVLKDIREINPDQEFSLKLEETCLWYRLIDELAYRHIPEQRNRFMDFFEGSMAHLLALPGGNQGRFVLRSGIAPRNTAHIENGCLKTQTQWQESAIFCLLRCLERCFWDACSGPWFANS
jgi:hypothetical protein